MKRRWKLSNPPKKSGWYEAYYYNISGYEYRKRFYSVENNEWYFDEECDLWCILGIDKRDRW